MTHNQTQPLDYLPVPQLQIPVLRGVNLGRAIAVILVLSLVVFAFLFWLVYIKKAAGVHSQLIRDLPAVNATLNSLSTVFLISGLVAILRRNYALHMRLMFSALVTSAGFFVCYVIYHNAHGDTRFPGTGWVRPIYFTILISHISLSAVAVPLILSSFYLSLSGRYSLHRRVSRITFPIWLYVSITGVVVYAFLKAYVH
jgi:putative membrane protein